MLLYYSYGYSQSDINAVVAPDMITPDTLVRNTAIQKYRNFYDNLEDKSKNSGFMRMLYKAVIRDDRRVELQADRRLRDESEYFDQYSGRTIRNIYVFRNDVFDRNDGFFRILNGIHIISREPRIARNLLFKEGSAVDAKLMVQNEQLLRNLDFLSSADIIVIPIGYGNDSEVDIYIVTRDKWSISMQIRSAKEGNHYFKLYDKNFLGSGYNLGVRTYLSHKSDIYGGNMLELSATNLFGTFYDGEFYAGKGYEERNYSATVKKDFIRSTDYMAGSKISYRRYYEGQMLTDTTYLIRDRDLEFWAGKSWYIPAIKHSLFVSGSYRNMNFIDAPEVAVDSNSYYHSHESMLMGFGIYRESFYQGNMIYGFGRTEDVPYGYKVEFNGGRYLDKYSDDKWYGSVTLSGGLQTRIGYIRGELFGDSFIGDNGGLRQGSTSLDIGWFSNLIDGRRAYVRQFLDISYTKGYGRDKGEGEMLTFNRRDSPNGYRFSNTPMAGNDRLVINTETVLFSPLFFYGFRFAFFGFADIGWLGDKSWVVANDFYSTIGLGVRVKNERLVFRAFQFRLGFALNKNGFPQYNTIRYTGVSELESYRFRPGSPTIRPYR